MKIKKWLGLVGCVALAQGAGVVGSIFTTSAIQLGWYANLVKPELAPPNWLFAPVWLALYTLMGVSLFLVWSSSARATESGAKRRAYFFFGLQLALNALWSLIFFGSTSLTINGLNNIGLAFLEIVLLWLAIVATILAFARISRPAAWLLAPYLIWVSFAAYLNLAIWLLN